MDCMPGLLTGLQPDKMSTNVLRLMPGMSYNKDGDERVVNSVRYEIDMATNGVGGLDVGAPMNGRDYFVYLLIRESDGSFGAMISHGKFAGPVVPPGGDPSDYVVYPAGWKFLKKLQFGFVYREAWDGIPDFHVSHWPMPSVRLTQAGYGSPWTWMAARDRTTNGAWEDLELGRWMPDNARMAYLNVETRCGGTQAGSVYLKSFGGQTVPLWSGAASPGNGNMATVKIRVDSLLKLQLQTTGDARAFVQILGYDMTEPS